MDIQPSNILPEIRILKPDVFRDERGGFFETFHAGKYRAQGIDPGFVQDNFSFSVKNVIRGLHYQVGRPQGKLVWVPEGEVFDVAVDVRRGSPTFGRWAGHLLSSENNLQLWIPAGFAHGFAVRSERALFAYKCTDFYDPSLERGIRWDDPDLNIPWEAGPQPVVSAKDRQFPLLAAIPEDDLPSYEIIRTSRP